MGKTGEFGVLEERAGQRQTQVDVVETELPWWPSRRRRRRLACAIAARRRRRWRPQERSVAGVAGWLPSGRGGRSRWTGRNCYWTGGRWQGRGCFGGGAGNARDVDDTGDAAATSLAVRALHQESRHGLSRKKRVNLRYLIKSDPISSPFIRLIFELCTGTFPLDHSFEIQGGASFIYHSHFIWILVDIVPPA